MKDGRTQWEKAERDNLDVACEYLRRYNYQVRDILAMCVAAVCDTSVSEMMTSTDISDRYARWLFLYAYRYMTSESFRKMAKSLNGYGKDYSAQSIVWGVNHMSEMITSNSVWAKRWEVIKRIIKSKDGFEKKEERKFSDGIVIVVPKHLKNKVEIIYED